MESIAIGCDISKGRCDVAIINQSGTLLEGSGGYDDVRRDHKRLRSILLQLHEKRPEARIVVGMEATAGLEQNWLAFFNKEKSWAQYVFAHRLNPLTIKRYLETNLHRDVNDKSAARGIAQYVLEKYSERTTSHDAYDGKVIFYRILRAQIQRRAEASQRLQSLLPNVHPELVQYCRAGIPEWVIQVIRHYPTADKLGRAKIRSLGEIPHVGLERAQSLVERAQQSVASMTDNGSALGMSMMIEEIVTLDRVIEDGKQKLEALMSDDKRIEILQSIPGIGTWSAIALALEIGDISRFATVRSLIAWTGLDPHRSVSGDGVVNHGISHRGNSNIRAILFMNVRSAILHNPVIAAFYQRLTHGDEPKPGMVAMVASMGKLLKIVYALLVSGKKFDANHEKNRAAIVAAERESARSTTEVKSSLISESRMTAQTLDAPITAKEAKRRRLLSTSNAAASGFRPSEVKPQVCTGAAASKVCAPKPAAKRRMLRT